jgi:hypothetical protein
MAEYGPPSQVRYSRLVWDDKGPWKRIAVWDVNPYYDSSSGSGADNLEQTIAFPVTPAASGLLTRFSGRIHVSKDGTELSSRATTEEENFLTLNLACEVASGSREPEQARVFFQRTMELSASGKSSPYLQGLSCGTGQLQPAP